MKKVIDNIIANFDFQKVHKAMVALNWQWSSFPIEIPTIGRLVTTARELLVDVSNEEPLTSCETGGFKAQKYMGEGDEVFLELSFHVDVCCCCPSWATEDNKIELEQVQEQKGTGTCQT